MPDLSKQRMATLTQAAGSNPRMQANQGSLAADLIGAAEFGVGLYQKHQATQELRAAEEAQSIFQGKVNKGAAQFEQLQRELEASEVTGARANARINSFLRQFNAEERVAILGAGKQLTGQSALASVSDAEQEATAARENYEELQVTAAQLSPYSTKPPLDIEAADSDTLKSYILDATANKASFDARRLQMEQSRIAAQDQAKTTKLTGAFEFNTFAVNNIVSQAKMISEGADLSSPEGRAEAVQLITELKNSLPMQMQQFMVENHNTHLSPTEAGELLQPVTTILSSLENDVLGEKESEIGRNQLNNLIQGVVYAGYQKNPEVVLPYLMAKDVGIDMAGMGEGAARALIEASTGLSRGTLDAEENLRETLEAQGIVGAPQERAVQQMRKMATKASNNLKELTDADKGRLTKGMLADLNPSSQDDLVRNMQDGLILQRIEELANPDNAQAYMGKSDEVAQGVKRGSDLLIQTLGTKFFTGQGQTGRGTQPLGDLFKYDSSTNEFVLRDPSTSLVFGRDVIRGINTTIRNTARAYDNLGRDDMKQQMIAEMQELFGEEDASQGANKGDSQ